MDVLSLSVAHGLAGQSFSLPSIVHTIAAGVVGTRIVAVAAVGVMVLAGVAISDET